MLGNGCNGCNGGSGTTCGDGLPGLKMEREQVWPGEGRGGGWLLWQ